MHLFFFWAENGHYSAEDYCSSAQSWVGAVTVCRGSDLAASGAANGVVRLWAIESDTKSIRPLYDLPLVSYGHNHKQHSLLHYLTFQC